MTVRAYSVHEQEAFLRRYVRQGTYRLGSLLHRKRDLVERMAIERAIGLGFEEYGDEMFHQSFVELERETLEELADGANRQAVYSGRERGVIL